MRKQDKIPKITIIVGPTASGKTAYGIRLAQQDGGAVISADSRQVYAGMNVGTAKPESAWSDTAHPVMTPDSVQGVEHYLLNIRTPSDPITLADWQAAAYHVIDSLLEHSIHPILVGGTMLYIDSIVFNYAIPNVPPNLTLRGKLTAQPAEKLYEQLLTKDPQAAAFIEPHHKQRIVRALEVIQATGQPFSKMRQQRTPKYEIEMLGLRPAWDVLEQRIRTRSEEMFASGLLQETQVLQRTYGHDMPLLQTMGYKEAAQILAGELTTQQGVAAFCRAQLRYARRQMSWWKRRSEIKWIEPAAN